MRRLAAVLLALAAAASAAEAPVVVATHVDRTALWPGDRVTWTVDITCAPGVDLLADDLAGEKLSLTGLELVSSSRERQEEPGGSTRYRVSHVFTAYTFGTPLAVAPQVLRYHERRPGTAEAEGAPAGEVELPGLALALRSTLPDDLSQARLRDHVPPPPLPRGLGLLRPAGLALLSLSALPVLIGVVLLVRRAAAAWQARRPRRTGDDLRRALATVQAVDAGTDAARRQGYDQLDALLRRRLTELAGADARALTPSEIGALVRRRELDVPSDLPLVLEDCERARYAPGDRLPSAERFRAGVAAAAALMRTP